MTRTLSHAAARSFYDAMGARLDAHAVYEDRAVDAMLPHLDLGSAHGVFEFGCGTGRLAERLLATALPDDATYRGVDLSPRMVELASTRLAKFGRRASAVQSTGSPPTQEPTGGYDRFVSTFVLDLLSEDDIRAVLGEAHRMLTAGGRLGLTSLGSGDGIATRLVAGAWAALHAIGPTLVGGCRPIDLASFLAGGAWRIVDHTRLSAFALPMESVVAERS